MHTPSSNTAALIVAAGRGTRFGGALPKQYALLGGRPVLRKTVDTFAAHPQVGTVYVVIHPDDEALAHAALKGLNVRFVHGGDSRQSSVYHGLLAMAADSLNPGHVLIHDGARPHTSPQLITRVLDALQAGATAVVPALTSVDALARVADGLLAGPVAGPTARLQTPQGFIFTDILHAHHAAKGRNLRDDTAVAQQADLAVHVVEGCATNIKITHPQDTENTQPPLSISASGYDVHRLVEDRPLVLCGVTIPHTHGLDGHSDADVAWHALTDALLGCIGGGDIGQHFPPSEAKWRGADSALFLRHAASLVRAQGGDITHVDVTLICQAPKIGPHREVMRTRTAAVLGISPDEVNIKATTTEGLGFTGRGEGIAAHATASIIRPRQAAQQQEQTHATG
ncbi:MAG: 2-C-methyl-D-erythritol 2,4-cyclodiphosphate synthase [Proteobacteria bacterium]|nr:2-C-methyl-D-erythritol 2,4-cyclodiphosphate synthase [Pseudomonadota bacterium]